MSEELRLTEGEANATRDLLFKNSNDIRRKDAALRLMLDALEGCGEAIELISARLGVCGHGDGKDHRADAEWPDGHIALEQSKAAIAAGREAIK